MNSTIIRNTNILGNAYTKRYDGLIITYNTLHSYNYILWYEYIHSKVADWNTILNSVNMLYKHSPYKLYPLYVSFG